jgi:hypothetical protein
MQKGTKPVPYLQQYLPFYYFAPQAGQTWCGRFFSPHVLQTPHGITDNASWLRRCALRALLVLLLGTAILLSFLFYAFYFITISLFCKENLRRTKHAGANQLYKSNNC